LGTHGKKGFADILPSRVWGDEVVLSLSVFSVFLVYSVSLAHTEFLGVLSVEEKDRLGSLEGTAA
jgi:hypothetical protein